MAFLVRLLLCSTLKCSQFTHVVAFITLHSYLGLSNIHNLFFYLSADEHLGCFHPMAIVNSAINIHKQISEYLHQFSGYIFRSKIAGLFYVLCLTF